MAFQTPDAPLESAPKGLTVLDSTKEHRFIKPTKKINEGQDVSTFLCSRAYSDIGLFIMQLNTAMCPKNIVDTEGKPAVKSWMLDDPNLVLPESIKALQRMLEQINAIIDEVPPHVGQRRFGNISFRRWYEILELRVEALLKEHLKEVVLQAGDSGEASAEDELKSYLLGGFGSAQRLDYGTGHELSFLAFLGCIWKLGGFHKDVELGNEGDIERCLILGVIEPYLRVVRRLILTYTLEPAGSHGVWGLDDHSFLPYIFGSAQYCPAISNGDAMPIEGSLSSAPEPGDITKKNIVEKERKTNMYFAAVGFINDVKTGSPFWEHSPMLFDISGIRTGWGKINKGMIKMFNVEVLSKFPVVQHFPFGSLFSWDQDPRAEIPVSSVHTNNQPSSHSISTTGNTTGMPTTRPSAQEGTKAPWASHPPTARSAEQQEGTRAPWATQTNQPRSTLPQVGTGGTAAPRAQSSGALSASNSTPATRAPWATQAPTARPSAPQGTKAPWQHSPSAAPPSNSTNMMPATRAPWATQTTREAPAPDRPTKAPWANIPDRGVGDKR